MPDYDPKNIPTLDDIIEDDEFNAVGLKSKSLDSTGMDSTGHDQADLDYSNLNHTNLDPVNIINVDLNTGSNTDAYKSEPEERAEAENSNLDLFLNETSKQQSDSPATSSDKNDHDTNDSSTNANPVFDVAPSEALKITLDPSELESIVESVVNTLLPDLEQQLRTRLRETLEDKLCEEVNTLLESEPDQGNNTRNI